MSETRVCRSDHRGVVLLNAERVCCLGLPEGPSLRVFGSLTLYWAVERPFRLCRDGQHWESGHLAQVAPYQPHRVTTDGPLLGAVLLEPERLAAAALPPVAGDESAWAARLQQGCERLQSLATQAEQPGPVQTDRLLFGAPLAPRQLDERVARVIERLHQCPGSPWSAMQYARLVGLSSSRFLHLFKQETGIPFRKLCAWKRARSLLYHVHRDASLTDIALDIGYPDSSHFSHSIRRVYGLPPREVIAGLRP